jgi:predicted RNA-binding protein with PIN domain
MRWLVDGYNVIRRDPELKAREAESLEGGRRALLHLIARAHRALQDEFTIVFDGAHLSGGTPPAGRIRVVFSRPPLTADDELMRRARQLRNGAVVVSSDRKVQDAARRAGSAVLTAEQFLEALDVPETSPGAERPDIKDASEDEPAREKRGNPRRLSKKARKAQRALGRLRQP